jgi:hypothetical protein
MLLNLFSFSENRKPKTENRIFGILAFMVLMTFAAATFMGCATAKKWVGLDKGEEDEELAPPESKQETVMIDGKPYIRSKNPYWLSYPEQPEYIYVEKGREFKGMQQHLIDAVAKAIGKEKDKGAKTLPPDKLQEMVKAEVDRILREQGLGGFVSQGKGEKASYIGRSVAVIPDLDTPRNYEGLNRTLALALGEALGRTKDIRVAGQEQVKEALIKAGVTGKLNLGANIKALGDYLGVQGIVLTGIMGPEKGAQGAMVLQIYDTFMGTKENSLAGTVETGSLNPAAVTKFANGNALRVTGDLVNLRWFGRVEFVKEGKVYLNLGQNAGLKVGDRLKVVVPGKAVVNPNTHAVLGYTADESQGELKVTELLGKSGAVALPLSGGPFKANDKVKSAKSSQ